MHGSMLKSEMGQSQMAPLVGMIDSIHGSMLKSEVKSSAPSVGVLQVPALQHAPTQGPSWLSFLPHSQTRSHPMTCVTCWCAATHMACGTV
jgi:hypothetical protein